MKSFNPNSMWLLAVLSLVSLQGCSTPAVVLPVSPLVASPSPGPTQSPSPTATATPAPLAAPTTISTFPANSTVNAAINGKLSVVFSTPMNPTTLTTTTFTVKQGTTPVAGTVTYNGTTAVFTPSSSLASSAAFTATITTGAKNLAGTAMASNLAWTFTTGATADTVAPLMTSSFPSNASESIGVRDAVTVTFSEAMDPATISSASFTLTQAGLAVAGSVTAQGKSATFTPSAMLLANAPFTAHVTTGVKDLSGNAMTAAASFSFTTGEAPVVLGSAGDFLVLAGTTVTNTGETIVNGNLGLSSGTATPGFGPGIVTGTIFASNPISAQAQLDLTTAYNDAAGRSVAPILRPGNLGGLTLTPGLYRSDSSMEISSGDLTLDAQGDPNAVFIFQMASTLTTTAGRQVILSGGAKAANIYWQVGSSATLGTTSVFKGNIMAYSAITLTTGAALEGRALTRIAAVAMDSNIITTPAR